MQKTTHHLLSMHFWRPICKPLKPHATTMLATQSADICPQRRWAHPSRNTFGVLCCSKPIFWENAKSCQELPRAAKSCQEPKANERRLLNYKLRFADHKTRSSATNASNNTGSAVLAPHGALGLSTRLPRSSWPMNSNVVSK